MKKVFLFTWMLVFVAIGLNAQNVRVSASASQNVLEVGEQFELQFTASAEPSNLVVPEVRDFKLLYGPSTQNSVSTQIINGKVTQSASYAYIYVMQAVKPGKYLIGAAEITVGGKKYKTNTISIEVVGNNQAKPQSGSNANSGQQGSNSSASDAPASSEGDLFLRIILDKKTVYQGERVNATIKFYSKLSVSQLGQMVNPVFNGCFQQELQIPPITSLQRENLNGQIYGTAVLKKYVLIPQKSGSITIEPLTIECVIRQQISRRSRNPLDDAFGPQVQEIPKKAKSLPVVINVKPLPANAPASFSGAVGKFSFNATIDKTSAKTNDAISFKVTVTGNGNIKLIDAPKIAFPSDFDSYDPKISENISATSGGVSGSKTFEYLLIPRNPGQFTIDPVSFSYFDTEDGQYKSLSSKDFKLDIAKGADNQSAGVVSNNLSREDVKYIGKDILYIKTSGDSLAKKDSYFFGSIAFYLLYAIGLVLFAAAVWMWRKMIRENANVALVRNRRANKFAAKRLKQAHVHLSANEKEKFYEELLKGIWGFLSDKLNIPQSELSRDTARELLEKRNVATELTDRFIALADNCEFARYAPSSAGIDMNDDYKKAIELITKLQQTLK